MTQDPSLSSMEQIAGMFSVDDYMYFYADFLNPEHNNQETANIVQLLGMERSMRVLDLACGFGRIANRMAVLGHDVTGIEYLPGFLEIARQEAEQLRPALRHRGGKVAFEQGDMRRVDYENEFDRVVMVFNSFGYFTDAENLDVLRKIARALKPGGLLGFDIAHRDGLFNNFHPHYVTEKGDSLMINRFSFDVLTGRLVNDRIIIRGGVRKDRPFSIRLYSVTEIRDLLASVGLALEQLYEEWDGSPLRMDSPSMVVIARKE